MNVKCRPFRKVVKQVLAVCRYILNWTAIDLFCIVGESALRRRKMELFTTEEFTVVPGDSVYRMAFWHEDSR
tara:strand:- start:228 stop:443 length:216 start_codon:yes stop_codon:yes gene_type:complete